jgi:hypothetical protein
MECYILTSTQDLQHPPKRRLSTYHRSVSSCKPRRQGYVTGKTAWKVRSYFTQPIHHWNKHVGISVLIRKTGMIVNLISRYAISAKTAAITVNHRSVSFCKPCRRGYVTGKTARKVRSYHIMRNLSTKRFAAPNRPRHVAVTNHVQIV